MAQAYIVEALRTAGGRRGGALRDWHPADLGAAVLDALVERSGIDPAAIEDVIAGCVGQIGEQSFHIGRNMVMASKLPDSVPAVSIDRQCGSSQQALHFAAQAVMSGTQDVVIASGVESMTRVPMGTPVILPMQAARDGSIVDLMDWRRPKRGDFIYNPAETIHALGPGLTVMEIHQFVDLT